MPVPVAFRHGKTHTKKGSVRTVEHGDASKAYREAFPASQKRKDLGVWKRASQMLRNGEVLGRISEL